MKNELCPRQWRCGLPFLCGLILCAASLASPPRAAADTPEWLRAVARATLPAYPEETDAVMLLDERVTTVRDSGEIKTVYRRAYKILRPQGRSWGRVAVHFDTETRLTFLKAWCIPAQGKDYEVKEKDAVEVGGFDSLYSDTRLKVLQIPAADPGNVIGYEYEQKRRPMVLQDRWFFQDPLPVRQARFTLQLPPGWEYKVVWKNHPPQEPRSVGENVWVWELQDLAAVEPQPAMPDWRSIAGWLAVSYFPRSSGTTGTSLGSWKDVGVWYSGLTGQRRQATPAIQQKVAELTASQTTLLEKLQALAGFAQRDIRYVAIEIGIGGYQPHAASDVFSNRYGDCKDKVTLLSTMLREIGVDSYYVLAQTDRGVVAREFPSVTNFNHAILAMHLPADVPTTTLFSLMEHPQLGRLLFFDPTDNVTSLGNLPASLQANYGLLVVESGGELVDLPLQAPATNRLLRTAKLELTPAGTLSGEVQEVRWGVPAFRRRAQFLDTEKTDRRKVLEDFLSGFLGGFHLTAAEVENLEEFNKSLVLRYRFVAENYAKTAGNLLLLRPRVLGQKSSSLLEGKERKYPVEFDSASMESDIFEITLPAGYKVEELPPQVDVDFGFAEYHSKVEVEGNLLRYRRDYKVKEVLVDIKRLGDLKKFYRTVAADERFSAVLQRQP